MVIFQDLLNCSDCSGGFPIGLVNQPGIAAMLVIKITNTREVMRKRIGRLRERLIGRVVDHEAQVEKAVMQELEEAFKSFGIEAQMYSIEDAEMVGHRLEIPIKLREQRVVGTSPTVQP